MVLVCHVLFTYHHGTHVLIIIAVTVVEAQVPVIPLIKRSYGKVSYAPDTVIVFLYFINTGVDEFLTKSMKKTKRTGLLQEAWMPGLETMEFNLLDDADIDEGECQKCHKSSVTGDDHLWVGCDTCKRWYHWKCLGYKRRPSKKQKIRCVSC